MYCQRITRRRARHPTEGEMILEELRVGLAGLGTVGTGVAKILLDDAVMDGAEGREGG